MTMISPATTQPTVPMAREPGACIRCGRPADDGVTQPGVGLLCEQCADLRRDDYLDWYDNR
jgi:hypothetical protein